ncbi:MAG: autotransporter outer membrane beta-barrel domain-containing protein [Desulfobulbaceae bacterium]|nr:autotransporter outer membrane beta-barrel domain-containing protein [Desulfobulbaceae bacterium]
MNIPISSVVHKITILLLSLLSLLCLSAQSIAKVHKENTPGNAEKSWSFPFRGGYVHQFDVDLDEGGSFSVNRFFIQGGPTYSPARRRSISFAVGYGYADYDFSSQRVLSNDSPWDDIHSFRFSLPVRWGIDNNWTFIAIPALHFTGENGTDWNKAITGGGFAGFSYRFNDRLTIGPGIGIISQMEDSTSVFPILLISWKIIDRLSLNTGSGLAASQGPGLTLNWESSDQWELHVGGRYEKLRFRLDKDGPAPEGIGEDTSFPLIIGATYHYNRNTRMSLIAGVELGGKLRLEDKYGRLLTKDNHDPAGFLGITFYSRL